jgi:hypothetical protein
MSKTKVSVDVRVHPIDKASWQAEADAAGVSVSELVRQRMKDTGAVAAAPSVQAPALPALTKVRVDLDAVELRPLRGWLDLADSDGDVDLEQLAEWKSYAAKRGIDFAELLQRVVLYVNVTHL